MENNTPLSREFEIDVDNIHVYGSEIRDKIAKAQERQINKDEGVVGYRHEIAHGIEECEQVLSSMESMMEGFEQDLGRINQEIEDLWNKSNRMSIKKANREKVESQLSKVVGRIAIDPDIIRKVQGEQEGKGIDDEYIKSIEKLGKIIENSKKANEKIKMVQESKQVIEGLISSSCKKIKDELVEKIDRIRKLATHSIQEYQSLELLKYKHLNEYLIEQHPQAAIEVCDTYIGIAKQFYYQHFQKYKNGLMLSKKDGETHLNQSNYVLGSRIDVLKTRIAAPLVKLQQADKLSIDQVFMNLHIALVDNASSEYEFIVRFFSGSGRSNAEQISTIMFSNIFEPTLQLMNDTTRQLADSGLRYDHVGLMIILRSFSLLQTILHLRKIAVLDSYFDGLGLMVWPKALLAVDALVERISLSPGTPGSLSTLASAASSLMNPPAVAVAAATKLKKFGLQLMKPKSDEHESTTFALDETRIYASFVSMLYKLEFDISVNSFSTSMMRLRQCLLKTLSIASSADKLTELVFLVNNYDLVVSILKENELSLVDSEFAFWTDLLDETINNYCEETLDFYFGYLTRFVKQQATKGENKGDENRDLGAKKVKEPIGSSDTSPLNGRRGNGDSAILEIPPLITQFNYEWKMQIAVINKSTIHKFSNFHTGTRIVQDTLRLLIIYYQHFVELCQALLNEKVYELGLLNVQTLMLEIKKYRTTF